MRSKLSVSSRCKQCNVSQTLLIFTKAFLTCNMPLDLHMDYYYASYPTRNIVVDVSISTRRYMNCVALLIPLLGCNKRWIIRDYPASLLLVENIISCIATTHKLLLHP